MFNGYMIEVDGLVWTAYKIDHDNRPVTECLELLKYKKVRAKYYVEGRVAELMVIDASLVEAAWRLGSSGQERVIPFKSCSLEDYLKEGPEIEMHLELTLFRCSGCSGVMAIEGREFSTQTCEACRHHNRPCSTIRIGTFRLQQTC